MAGPVRVKNQDWKNATVWRVAWEDGAFTFRTDWSIHYESVRSLYGEYKEAMPGADVRLEEADVSEVENVRKMNFDDQ